MTTVVDALQAATLELHNASTLLQTLAGQVQTNLNQTTTNTTQIINNFLGKPPVQTVWVDPVNGNDANDGSSPQQPKRSIDDVLDNIGTTATAIRLLNDALVRRNHPIFAALVLEGAQIANTAAGYILVNRQISFLGTAENSPDLFGQTYCAGFWLHSGNGLSTNHITWRLPPQAAGQTRKSHIYSDNSDPVYLTFFNLLVDDVSAGALIGSLSNTINAFLSGIFGTGSPGHIFENVAANTNPNNVFQYRTNITSG